MLGERDSRPRAVGKAKSPGRYPNRVARKPELPPTLAEAGFDKNLAKDARLLATVPEEQFAAALACCRPSAA